MSISRDEIITHVNTTLVDEFEILQEDISPDKRLREDLELDSLDAVDMIVALEKGLKIRVDEEAAKQIATVGDIYDFVENMLSAPATSPNQQQAPAQASAIPPPCVGGSQKL